MSTVYIVDDDVYVREGLENLLQSVRLEVATFASVDEFLKNVRPDAPGCLVLDVRLPGLSGLDFQAELAKSNNHMPIVFITGHGDIPMAVRAMKAGAVEFLAKPVREQDLLDAVRIALYRDRSQREAASILTDLKARFELLTARERDVVVLVTVGKMNKQVASELGLSEVTVKVNRHNAMKKLGAKSLPDLVRMADAVGFTGRSETSHTDAAGYSLLNLARQLGKNAPANSNKYLARPSKTDTSVAAMRAPTSQVSITQKGS